MKTIEKSKKLDNVCYDIRGPVMDEAERMAALGEEILKLNIGNPAPFGFKAPENIIKKIESSLTKTEGYSTSKGLIQAREAIAKYCKEKKNIQGVTADDVYTGNGVSELITMSMQGLLDSGDEILVPSPDYPLWTASVTLAGGTAVHYICDEKSDWQPDINDIRSKINHNTKGIVVINPNNPTGALYSKEILQQIADLATEHSLIIFADEIYDRLVMEGEHISIATLAPDTLTITYNGLSKSHLIAGYRCGWMTLCGNKKNVRGYIEGLNLLSSMRLCSNVPAQSVIDVALESDEETKKLIVPGGRVFEQRELIYNEINSIPGLSAVKPKAAFYIFPKIDIRKFNISNDEKFVLDLLKDKKILLTHGGGFHWEKPDHFRIVFLPEISQLKKAVDELRDFLSYYKQ